MCLKFGPLVYPITNIVEILRYNVTWGISMNHLYLKMHFYTILLNLISFSCFLFLSSYLCQSYSFRRGTYPSTIFSLSFGPSADLPDILLATSSSGSVHIFSLGFDVNERYSLLRKLCYYCLIPCHSWFIWYVHYLAITLSWDCRTIILSYFTKHVLLISFFPSLLTELFLTH